MCIPDYFGMARGICDGIWNTSLGGYLPSASCRDFSVVAVQGAKQWLTWKDLITLVQMGARCLLQQGCKHANEAPWAKNATAIPYRFPHCWRCWWHSANNIVRKGGAFHTRPSPVSEMIQHPEKTLRDVRFSLGFPQTHLPVSTCSAGDGWSSQDFVCWPCQLESITWGTQRGVPCHAAPWLARASSHTLHHIFV